LGDGVRILLDTCAFIWLASDPGQLGPAAKAALEDPHKERFLSLASVWEIVLKYNTGKLPLPRMPEVWIEEQARIQDITILSLERGVIYKSGTLPSIHRDPFDRMIASDSLFHKMPILTPDGPYHEYGCQVIW
jgi:PIN domain nuclease of toxin-antitoxin system